MNETEASSQYGNYGVLTRPDGSPELLGVGSFGKTYKARHVFLDQVVALKVISEKFAHDANAKERFLREARVVHGLRHPHIAQIVDFGAAQGTLYYAMEYCEGGSLEDLVRRVGPLDPATVTLLARQLAEALECSHRHGFIHRDVKPANVMLIGQGGDAPTLKLVDFGLVKPLVADHERMASLTLDGQNFFTPLFASPEQVMEEALDARSDLFSLGMTLWFLLKGETPESGSTAMVMAKRLSAESYQAQLPATLPPKLRAILRRLLEKDKTRRFTDASEVLAALDSDRPLPELEDVPAEPPVTATKTPDEADPSATLALESPARLTRRLADKYQIVEKSGRSSLGNLYCATRAGDGVQLFVTVLDDALREDAMRMDRLRAAVALSVRCTHESLCQVYGLEKFADAEVLVREWNGGVGLQNVVKSRGSIPFAEAIVLLRMIAAGVDHAAAAGLSGVRLTPDEIFLQPADGSLTFADEAALLTRSLRQWPPFSVRLTPVLIEDEPVQDVSMTFSEQTGGSPRVEFGSLLYRLVAGMQVKFAARVNRGSYVRTANLSEEGNRILSDCIADDTGAPADCRGLLTALQSAEGIGNGEHESAATVRPPGATTRRPSQTFGNAPVLAPPAPASVTQSTRLKTSPALVPPPAPPPLSVAPPGPTGGTGNASAASPSSPLAPILIGLAAAIVVLAMAAFLLLRNQPLSSRDRKHVHPSATPTSTVANATATPSQTFAAQTPVPTPTASAPLSTFVLHNAGRLPSSTNFELGGHPVTPTRNGDDLVFTLDSAADPAPDLVVKVPGYRAVRLSVGAGGSAVLPATLERQTLPVFVAFRSRDADYAFITFSYAAPLTDENVPPPADSTYSLRNFTPPARLLLPTGKYNYTLYGPSQQQDSQIAPLRGSVTVKAPGRIEVPVPPSYAGRFRGEFDDDNAHLHVVRTISLKPGLTEGSCDEQYFVGGKLNDRSVDGVPLAEIHLDGDGVLHAHIRYAAYRNPASRTYDELFELRHNAAGELVMTGGRETMPNDPVMRSELERKLKDQPPVQGNRPGETVLRPVD